MKQISKAMIFAFQEVLRWDTMKFVLAGGIVATLVWAVLGFFMWDGLVALGAKVVELVPFSMVRSNGAWLISAFLWFQTVLLSFALFFAFFSQFILRRVSKERYAAVSMVALIGFALLWGIVWLINGDTIHEQLVRFLTWLPFETVEKSIAALIALYVLYNAIIITVLFLSNVFSPAFLELIEIREFGEDRSEWEKVFTTLRYTLKDTLIFLVLSLVAFPLLFIPVLNVIVQTALWMWLYKETLAYSATLFASPDEGRVLVRSHRGAVWFLTFIAVMFNFIPVLNIFGPIFGIVALFYYFRTL